MAEIYVKYGHNGKELTKDLLEHMQVATKIDAPMKIGIKPNLVLAKPSASGATTDPQIIAGIIEYLQDHGCKKLSIMESSWLGDSTKHAWKVCGYMELAKRYQVELIDLKEDTVRQCQTTHYKLGICASILDLDYLINVPVLKAHCQTKLTCALKNMKGCIPDQEKRRYHTLGLHGPIASLNTIIKQSLIIVDGLIGDLTFEEGGTPVHMNRVIAGYDPVAIDAYCANLLGYDPEDIPYLQLAEKLGVGTIPSTLISLNKGTGDSLIPSPAVSYLRKNIKEKAACSACLGSLLHALQRLNEVQCTISDPIHIGQGYKNKSADGIGIGQCTQNYSKHVPGCPPSAREIITKLHTF